MDAERWRRIEELYHAAEERPEPERAEWLERECGGDGELRREVLSLLGQESRSYLERPALAAAARQLAAGARVELMGRRLGRYEIRARIGAGGMGEVYLALDTKLKREVALKVLPAVWVADAERKRRFEKEAHAASALNHPNIVTTFDMDQAEGVDFIAMEYVPGRTLDKMIPKGGLAVKEVLRYGIEITGALTAAHAAGIVHRDLKPSNVMVSEGGRVKVLDFGIAKMRSEPMDEAAADEIAALAGFDSRATLGARTLRTEAGVVMGTVDYMSPEQVRGRAVDVRTDLFSLGVVLYEMATGERPFRGNSALDVAGAILEAPVRGFGGKRLPAKLKALIRKLVEKDPGKRPANAAEVQRELRALEGSLVPMWRRGWFWAAAAGLAVAAVAGTLWGFFGSWGKPGEAPPTIPLTAALGFSGSPSFAPDGERLAYYWFGAPGRPAGIYLKRPGEDEPTLLTPKDKFGWLPSWSPDGHWIAFLRAESATRMDLMVMPASGGSERKMTELAEPNPGVILRLAWCADSRRLIVPHLTQANGPMALYLVSSETGQKRQLTTPPPKILGDLSPAVAADGRRVAFVRADNEHKSEVYEQELSEDLRLIGEPRRVTYLQRCSDEPAWWPDGKTIIFESGSTHLQVTLWKVTRRWFGRGWGEPERLPFSSPSINLKPVVSRQGRVAWMESNAAPNRLRRIALDARGEPEDLPIRSAGFDFLPEYSPEGKRMAFLSNRSGSFEIWVCDPDGLNLRKLTSFGGPSVGSPIWSPDGRRLVFGIMTNGANELYMVGADGGKAERLRGLAPDEGLLSWSRDGRWLYTSRNIAGKNEMWKIPSEGGEAVQVAKDIGNLPMESPDGRFLYYMRPGEKDTADLCELAAGGGEERRIVRALGSDANFTVGRSGVYFTQDSDTPAVRKLDFATRKVKPAGTVDKPAEGESIGRLVVSPDEKWLLYVVNIRWTANLKMVEGYRP